MPDLTPFTYRLSWESGSPVRRHSGCLVVLASSPSSALAAGREAVQTKHPLDLGATVLGEWLERMVPFVVSKAADRRDPEWRALTAGGAASGLFFCSATAPAARESFTPSGLSSIQVNGLVSASDLDDAEAVWATFVEAELPGLVVSEIVEDLPPVVTEN
jgi:hypothetical protein